MLSRDDAADTVIGFILIALISLMAITVVLLGGTPTLERVQSQQEGESMLRYFQDLESQVGSLIAGAPEGVTPVWRVAMPRGDLSLEQGHIWAYAVDLTSGSDTYRIDYDDFGDGNNVLTIRNAPTGSTALPADTRIEVRTWAGAVDTLVTTINPGAIATGATHVLDLTVPLTDATVELRFFLDATSLTPVARAWFVDGGALVWHLPAGGQTERVVYQNTAIISQQGSSSFVSNEPKLRQPKERTPTIDDVFMRIVRVDGTVAASGRGSTDVLLSSGGSHTRYGAASVDRVQIYPPLRWQAAWGSLLDNDHLGYTFTVTENTFAGASQTVALYEAGGKTLATSFVQTDINAEVVSRS